MAAPVDARVYNGGSVFTVTPLTPAAREWVDEHVQLQGWQWIGPAFAVEHRFIVDIVTGMREAGLVVE